MRRGYSVIELSLVMAIIAMFAAVAWTTLQTSQESSSQEIARLRLALLEVELKTLQNQPAWAGVYASTTYARVSVGGMNTVGGITQGGQILGEDQVVGSTGPRIISVEPMVGNPQWAVGALRYEQDGGVGCLIVAVGPGGSRWAYDPEIVQGVTTIEGSDTPVVASACRASNPSINTTTITGTMLAPNIVDLQ